MLDAHLVIFCPFCRRTTRTRRVRIIFLHWSKQKLRNVSHIPNLSSFLCRQNGSVLRFLNRMIFETACDNVEFLSNLERRALHEWNPSALLSVGCHGLRCPGLASHEIRRQPPYSAHFTRPVDHGRIQYLKASVSEGFPHVVEELNSSLAKVP